MPEGAEDPTDIDVTTMVHHDRVEVALGYRLGAVALEVAEQLLHVHHDRSAWLVGRGIAWAP